MTEIDFRLGLCTICKSKPATQFCDYIMEYHNNIMFVRDRKTFNEVNRRGQQYETCDLPLCINCSFEVSRDHDLCPHHFALYGKRELPTSHQQKRRGQARGYLASHELSSLKEK